MGIYKKQISGVTDMEMILLSMLLGCIPGTMAFIKKKNFFLWWSIGTVIAMVGSIIANW